MAPKRPRPLGHRSTHHGKLKPDANESANPCSRCPTVDWKTLHALHVELISCPADSLPCDACEDLADIDAQITNIFNTLLILMKRRQDLLPRLNSRHDGLIRRLPIELVSRIFISVEEAAREDDNSWSPPVELGAVCRQWRDITLATPQLWASVTIDLRTDPDRLDFVKEWLRRSGDVPLDLTIWCSRDHEYEIVDPSDNQNFDGLRETLRAEARRWHHLNLDTEFGSILDDFESMPPVNILTISSENIPQVRLRDPLRPKVLFSKGYAWMNIPIQWDNLTTLEITNEIDDVKLLNVIENAKQLSCCVVEEVDLTDSDSISSIISHSLEHLETDGKILPFMTLPSLRYLKCDIFGSSQINELIAFIDRSRAPLQTFAVHYILSASDDPVFDGLPTITQLLVTFLHGSTEFSTVTTRINRFLGTLACDRTSGAALVLPSIQKLDLEMWTTGFSLPLFADIFPRGIGQTQHCHTRPLSSVSIFIRSDNSSRYVEVDPDDFWIDKKIFLRLLEIRKSGVKLDIWIREKDAEHGDIFKYLLDHVYKV